MQKLINSVQNYAWGSKTALTELYGMENPSSQPMAELWMGAHPKSSSRVQSAAILFCVEGDATLWKGSQQLQLKPGESAFIAANESPVTVKGHGRLARVYNKL